MVVLFLTVLDFLDIYRLSRLFSSVKEFVKVDDPRSFIICSCVELTTIIHRKIPVHLNCCLYHLNECSIRINVFIWIFEGKN